MFLPFRDRYFLLCQRDVFSAAAFSVIFPDGFGHIGFGQSLWDSAEVYGNEYSGSECNIYRGERKRCKDVC